MLALTQFTQREKLTVFSLCLLVYLCIFPTIRNMNAHRMRLFTETLWNLYWNFCFWSVFFFVLASQRLACFNLLKWRPKIILMQKREPNFFPNHFEQLFTPNKIWMLNAHICKIWKKKKSHLHDFSEKHWNYYLSAKK